jgi:hypothetical protein
MSKAYAEERSRKEVVLFPTRIDNTVTSTAEPWAAKFGINATSAIFASARSLRHTGRPLIGSWRPESTQTPIDQPKPLAFALRMSLIERMLRTHSMSRVSTRN